MLSQAGREEVRGKKGEGKGGRKAQGGKGLHGDQFWLKILFRDVPFTLQDITDKLCNINIQQKQLDTLSECILLSNK